MEDKHGRGMKDYYDVLKQVHRLSQPKTYVEIGVRNGNSLMLALPSTLCVGIDPDPSINVPTNADSQIFKSTSDEFFRTHDLGKVLHDQALDLAFIDGMHLFEYALRDFANLEKHCRKDSHIVIHDCLPPNEASSQRERATQIWTGDVWKMIPCLRKYRPDLRIHVLGTPPSGLAVITNLDAESSLLTQNLVAILKEFVPLRYDYFIEHKKEFLAISPSRTRLAKILRAKTDKPLLSRIGSSIARIGRDSPRKPRCLCVLLCYNDADILPDVIEYMLENGHDIIAWDHGSDDGTADVLNHYKANLKERKFVPRTFDFYELYPAMSRNIIENWISKYDWISWPDEDEILEGPDRKKSYYEYIRDAYNSSYNYIRFDNYNFWFTEEDDPTVTAPTKRIRRYSIFPDCAPRIRAWRASATNVRQFNHNAVPGREYPTHFKLRHYAMRSEKQMSRRLERDRAGLQRQGDNFHYENMKTHVSKLYLRPDQLHRDDGLSDLDPEMIFNWREIWGYEPEDTKR